MKIVSKIFNRLVLCFLICSTYTSYAQLRPILFSEYIDSSSVIIVGRVEKSEWLDSTSVDSVNGAYIVSVPVIDGKIFTVSINRVLKGVSSLDTLDIITFEGDGCGSSELSPVFPFPRKTYLLFLDTARVPSALITKYNLQGRTFFAPFFCGMGVVDLIDQEGVNMLRETEDSLGITPTLIDIIPLTGWIDSLRVVISQALGEGLIGDSAFVDSLHNVLNGAQTLLLQGDSISCAQELVRFNKMIDGTISGFDRIRFVNINLWSSLTRDVLYLRSNLPDVPDPYESLPHVDSLTPNSTRAGQPGFTLTLHGERFENGAAVYWNWSPRPTTFVSPTEVRATITSQDIAHPDTATVAIVNPGGGTHGAWFIVTPRPTYTLSVSIIGSGTVTRIPNQPTYDSASTVQLTAMASEGSCFIGWSGDATGVDNPITVPMHGNRSITATFATHEQLALENKSCSSDATATNNARHLARSDGYLHEVFTSGGEIFYRRSQDGGSNWDQTHRLNSEVGENSHPCITVGESGTLQVVWQRKIAPLLYEVWHTYSQDRGKSWSAPTILPGAGQVAVSQYQPGGAMPVIAERKERSPVVVYCSRGGLRYRISDDDGVNWQTPNPDIIGSQSDRVRFPSLVGRGSYMYLLYDYADDNASPYSRMFNGSSWTGEVTVGKETGSVSGTFSSVAIDVDKNPIAAWSSAAHEWSRSIVFRAGYSDNRWSSWFVEFWGGQVSPDWVNPSVTYYNREGQYSVAIVHHTGGDAVHLIVYDERVYPSWSISTVSETGRWASITQENATSGTPLYCWTDQGAFPHEVILGSSGLGGRGTGELTTAALAHRRRAVVHHRALKATLSLELEPLKLVLATGDTTVVGFKRSSLRQPNVTFANMWDYLGSDTLRLPANARWLVISKQFAERGPKIAQRKFYLHLLNRDGTVLAVLDSSAASGTVSVNVAAYAGREVIVRPQVVLVGVVPSLVEVGVGDVFIVPDTHSKPMKGKTKKK
jgi:hypothetical protein